MFYCLQDRRRISARCDEVAVSFSSAAAFAAINLLGEFDRGFSL